MVAINPNIPTTYAYKAYNSSTASPAASCTATSEPDYSKIKELLEQSEKKVASAKKDLDAAEARLDKAREHFKNFAAESEKKYGTDISAWPALVRNEYHQLHDFVTTCQLSVGVAEEVYDQALKTHRKYMTELSTLIANNLPLPTTSGSVTGSNNVPNYNW